MKVPITHCTVASKAPIEPFRVEKPPVARVVSAWQTASKTGTRSAARITTSTAVSTAPTMKVSRAVSVILGSVFSGVGPGASAESTSTPHCRRPSRKTKRITMPSPPSHWVRARHSSSDRGSDSTSAKMLAPVVEKPEADSKIPFTTKPGPNKATYGAAPTTVARPQATTTNR